MSKLNTTDPDPVKTNVLVSSGYSLQYIPLALQLSDNSVEGAAELIDKMQHRFNELQDNNDAIVPKSSEDEPTRRNSFAGDVKLKLKKLSHELSQESCCACNDDSLLKKDQLIACSRCGKCFHSYCVGLRRIPISIKNAKDCVLRDKYVANHFASWMCSKCAVDAPPAAATKKTTSSFGSLAEFTGISKIFGRAVDREDMSLTQGNGSGPGSGSGHGANSPVPTRSSANTPSITPLQTKHDQAAIG